jgi:pimeloyl-ACP methyl ester carboxylesterase
VRLLILLKVVLAGSLTLVVVPFLSAGAPLWAESLPEPLRAEPLAVDGGRIYYEEFGSGAPLVFIHDGLAHSEVWDGQVADLYRNYRVVRYDRRGYGRSDEPAAAYSNIEDLEALMTHLDLTSVVLVGSSSGGGLALDYALEHPERVAALILCGAVVRGLGYSSHFNTRNMGNFASELEPRIENWVADPYTIAPGNDAARARLRELLSASPHDLDFAKHRLNRQPDWTALPRLGEIAVPVLLVTAEHDIPDVQAHAGAIEAAVTGARRIVLEDAGHLSYLEQPEAFNKAVREFLSLISIPSGAESAVPGPQAEPPWNTFERGFATTPSTDLYYERMGEGEPLVLLHGGMIDHRMWDEQFVELARRFRVLRYTSGNHGLSRIRGGNATTYEDLGSLMDHLDLKSSHLMGLSLGGRIAVDFAIAHPERVRSLTLVSSGLSGYEFTSPEYQASEAKLVEAWLAADWPGVIEAFLDAWAIGPHRGADEVDPAVLQQLRRMGASPIRVQLGGDPSGELSPPAIGRLSEVRAPTLAILGDLDMPSIHEILGRVRDEVPEAELVTFAGAAHMVNLEQPDRFLETVLEFLERVDEARGRPSSPR